MGGENHHPSPDINHQILSTVVKYQNKFTVFAAQLLPTKGASLPLLRQVLTNDDMELQAQPSVQMNPHAVVPRSQTSEDLISRLGIQRGLQPRAGDHEQQIRCPACGLWRGNPLGHFQSLVGTARKARPISLLRSVECWDAGRELGCVLCRLVSAAVASIRGSAGPSRCDAAQLSITPIRPDFPHAVFVLGLSGQEGRWKVEWRVELYATSGRYCTKKLC